MKLEELTQRVMEGIFVELEASGRHVHVTAGQAQQLFGHPLTPQRPLSQPGQYLARERLTVRGPKGAFENVAVLGPERKQGQVELSLTDARSLGIQAPIRLSGQLDKTPGARLVGPEGEVALEHGVIVAQRHIHLDEAAAKRFSVTDGQRVRLQVYTRRPVIFEDTVVRVRKDFAPAVHLDYDEANACGFQKGDLGRILP